MGNVHFCVSFQACKCMEPMERSYSSTCDTGSPVLGSTSLISLAGKPRNDHIQVRVIPVWALLLHWQYIFDLISRETTERSYSSTCDAVSLLLHWQHIFDHLGVSTHPSVKVDQGWLGNLGFWP